MTVALEGGEGSAACPGHTLPPGKIRYPFYSRRGGPQGRSGWAENPVPTGIRSRTVQHVVSRYTDLATWPTYRRLGGPQGRSGRAENLVPTGIRSQTVQPVVSRYTELPGPLTGGWVGPRAGLDGQLLKKNTP